MRLPNATTATRALRALVLTALLSGASASAALGAEGPSPQAVATNSSFLVGMPAPATAGVVCVVDTGVDLSTDAAPAITARYAVDNSTPDDVGATGLAK